MEIIQFSALLLITFLFVLLLLKLKSQSNKSTCHLPPGPWRLPLIGNIHQLVGSQPPHQSLGNLAKKHGPLMHFQIGEISTVVVSSPDTAKQVMKTHDTVFASRPPIIASEILAYNSTSIIFSPYGEYWRKLRKICASELLSPSRVQSFRYIREEETSDLVRWIASNAGKVINLTEKIHSSTFSTTSRAAFGKKSEEQETFVRTIKEAINLAAGFNIADAYPSIKFLHLISGVKPKLDRLHKQLDSILEDIINEHRVNGLFNSRRMAETEHHQARKDLVDVLLEYHEDENHEFSMTVDNIKAVLLVSDLYMIIVYLISFWYILNAT
ncbi:hypothetical protein ACH5RR_002724 [Cinchona calisaya]|uniref:Cytochrome P450 n=1 Tax=Cinchona calisaya TaxID=153742 RepID=A0ABD3ASS2_9GENT